MYYLFPVTTETGAKNKRIKYWSKYFFSFICVWSRVRVIYNYVSRLLFALYILYVSYRSDNYYIYLTNPSVYFKLNIHAFVLELHNVNGKKEM